jgi:hypothetical protein
MLGSAELAYVQPYPDRQIDNLEVSRMVDARPPEPKIDPQGSLT